MFKKILPSLSLSLLKRELENTKWNIIHLIKIVRNDLGKMLEKHSENLAKMESAYSKVRYTRIVRSVVHGVLGEKRCLSRM